MWTAAALCVLHSFCVDISTEKREIGSLHLCHHRCCFKILKAFITFSDVLLYTVRFFLSFTRRNECTLFELFHTQTFCFSHGQRNSKGFPEILSWNSVQTHMKGIFFLFTVSSCFVWIAHSTFRNWVFFSLFVFCETFKSWITYKSYFVWFSTHAPKNLSCFPFFRLFSTWRLVLCYAAVYSRDRMYIYLY